MLHQPIDFIALIQEFTAIEAPGGAALRNQERGVLRVVQAQLAKVQLARVPSDDAAAYCRWLDCETQGMLEAMTVKFQPWGAARKALNLFMRSCICDYHLRSAYNLERIEPLAEMPLDSIVAAALRHKAGRGRLPVWPGLKWLTRDQNDQFQAFAAEYSEQLGLPARVYLDNYLWLENR